MITNLNNSINGRFERMAEESMIEGLTFNYKKAKNMIFRERKMYITYLRCQNRASAEIYLDVIVIKDANVRKDDIVTKYIIVLKYARVKEDAIVQKML